MPPVLLVLSLLVPPQQPAAAPAPAAAQIAPVCGMAVPPPAALPPAGSEPVLLSLVLCFEEQGGISLIDPSTYLAYITLRPSEPSRGHWVPYDAAARAAAGADFTRLWDTGFLDDLTVEAHDRVLPNGVTAKVVVYRMEERQRVKVVRYTGASHVSSSDIDEALLEQGVRMRLDTFVDAAAMRKVTAVIRGLYEQKGYLYTTVTPVMTPVEGGPKLVQVDFQIAAGPRVRIRDIEFVGNVRVSDETLATGMKANRAHGLQTMFGGGGVYQPEKFAEDAENVASIYRDRGYVTARVGQPAIRVLEDSDGGETRWVQLRIPVDEGESYRLGTLGFEGNTVLSDEVLERLSKQEPGEVYSDKQFRKLIESLQEVYGAAGYYEFTAYPDLKPRPESPDQSEPTVDLIVRIEEGPQYFVRRIDFSGNTYTQDSVIRREMGLLEGGVFNTEALKYSIRRLNQLGYFKPLDGPAIKVEKAPGEENKLDVELKVEEQNRNQLTFGGGVSQYEGFFGNASYTTTNFMGRGESLTLAAQKGSRATNYQISFTEPYLFNRQMTAGASVFSRKIDYRLASDTVDYSEVRAGATVTAGLPMFARFLRGFVTYGYEVIHSEASEALSGSLGSLAGIATGVSDGRQVQSSVTPSLVYNTVDNPMTPRNGLRLSGSYEYAGGLLGGSMDFVKPELEATWYLPLTRRTALGVHAAGGWLQNYGTEELPYYLRFFLGGENSIRGYDLRTVGPLNDDNLPLGGSKFVQFNAELYYDVMPQVRAMLFHDAGQAFASSARVNLRELRTSSGAELRITLPIIGVPFRLIYAWNIYRDSFQPARSFRFAVGSTF